MNSQLAKLLLLVCLMALSVIARAEGGCPPGQYPIGGQGVRGCAPIPGTSSTSVQPADRRPKGEWQDQWGALAGAVGGAQGGAAQEQSSEYDATRTAIENCERQGGQRCKVEFVYHNQCAAAAISNLPQTGTQYAGGPTISSATNTVLASCSRKGGQGCKVIYSACSLPVFHRR